MPARKKSTAKSGKKRVSRAEPKTIIKRKKATTKRASSSKKAATPKRAGRKATTSKSVGTNKDVARRIVKMRNSGMSWPKIKSETGLGGMTIRRMYSEASGKDWQDATIERSPSSGGRKRSGGSKKKAAVKKSGAKKRAGRRSVEAETERPRKSRKTKAAKKSRASKNGGTETTAKAGRGKAGRKAKKDRNRVLLKDVIWDTDTDLKTLKTELKGKRITVEREGLRPAEFRVAKVLDTEISDREGKIIHYKDDDGKDRYVATREIVALR